MNEKTWHGDEGRVRVLASPDWKGNAIIEATVDGFVKRWDVLADELAAGEADSNAAPKHVLIRATAIAAVAAARAPRTDLPMSAPDA